MTTREAMIRAAAISGDPDAAERLRAKSDQEVEEGFRGFYEFAREASIAVTKIGAAFAECAPALRTAIERIPTR